jgi:hypothetical protein
MDHASVYPTSPPTIDEIQAPSGRRLLLFIEEKVFVQLDAVMDRDDSPWYLDSGATNHMLGCR